MNDPNETYQHAIETDPATPWVESEPSLEQWREARTMTKLRWQRWSSRPAGGEIVPEGPVKRA